MDDGVRAVVIGRADEERVCELASALRGMRLRAGDVLRLDPRSNMLLEKLPRPEVEDLVGGGVERFEVGTPDRPAAVGYP